MQSPGPNPPRDVWRASPRALLILAVLAGFGLVLGADAAFRGELRHRVAGVAIGALLVLPFVAVRLWGERAMPWARRLGVSVLSLAVLIVGTEGVVRILDVRAISFSRVLPDPVLGHVREPGRGGMDDWGYPNPVVPGSADVVCMGDSQTFGTNILLRDAWPRVLGRRSGLEVYNMSLGGYGPIQYLAMVERALELSPEVLVVGFYFGNDVRDAQRFAGLEHWADLRDPRIAYEVPADAEFGDPRSLNLAMTVIDGLLERSRVLGTVGERLKVRLKTTSGLAETYYKEDVPATYGRGGIKTIFAPSLRTRVQDLGRRVNRDGMRITELCLERLARETAERNVRLVLLLIHTKEHYYHALLAPEAAPEAALLEEVAAAEAGVTTRLLEIARDNGALVVDPEPEVLRALRDEVPLWPHGHDGHLNVAGSALFAEVLWRELREHAAFEGRGR